LSGSKALWTLGCEQTALGSAPRFQPDASIGSMDAIGCAGAVVSAQRFEFPTGARDHVNAPFAIHQNGEIAIFRPSCIGGCEDLFGVLEESAHEILIVRRARYLRKMSTSSRNLLYIRRHNPRQPHEYKIRRRLLHAQLLQRPGDRRPLRATSEANGRIGFPTSARPAILTAAEMSRELGMGRNVFQGAT
jgi:hypothetical protein